MKLLLTISLIFVLLAGPAFGQAWSGVLNYMGAGSCTLATPSKCGIDWSLTGVVGGIPSGSWTQCGATITSGASVATIQNALNRGAPYNTCSGNQKIIQLAAGTYDISAELDIGSDTVLRGAGASQTTLNLTASVTRDNGILIGKDYASPGGSNPTVHTTISSGATSNSTAITVVSHANMKVDGLLVFSVPDANNPAWIEALCGYCQFGLSGSMGQTVRITGCGNGLNHNDSCTSNNVTIYPPTYIDYSTLSPDLYVVTDAITSNAGIENLKVSKPGATSSQIIVRNIEIGAAYNTWVSGVESDFNADTSGNGADHIIIATAVNNTVQNSFIHDSYKHQGGCCDSTMRIMNKASANLIQNNIFWRQHTAILISWGASGNVVGYNYVDGEYHNLGNAYGWKIEELAIGHGQHPMFNLVEGNIIGSTQHDTSYGSTSMTTYFRNWHRGAVRFTPPADTRGALVLSNPSSSTCTSTPTGPCWEDGNPGAMIVGYNTTYNNQIGDVMGAAHVAGLPSVVDHYARPSATPGNAYNCWSVGYDDSPLGAVGGAHATIADLSVSSLFQDGINNCLTNAIVWASGQHSIPNSFYLASKPSWWNSRPWPPIGPDITGGVISYPIDGSLTSSDSVANGHVNNIPALDCFNTTTSNGTTNTGSFTPDVCYAAAPSNFSAQVNGNIKVVGNAVLQ